jgi:hypothetical protein
MWGACLAWEWDGRNEAFLLLTLSSIPRFSCDIREQDTASDAKIIMLGTLVVYTESAYLSGMLSNKWKMKWNMLDGAH